MQRSLCTMLLTFSAILLIALESGCRRAGEPQKVDVQIEKEDFYRFSAEELTEKLRPKKKMTVQPGQMKFGDEYFQPGVEIVIPPPGPEDKVAEELAKKSQDAFEQAKKDYEKRKQREHLVELGVFYTGWAGSMRVGDRSFDNLKKDLRRANKKGLRDLMDRSVINVVMEVDFSVPGHYVAYFKEGVAGQDEGNPVINVAPAKAASPVVLSHQKPDQVEEKVQEQQLWLVRKHFEEFGKKTPLNQRDGKTFSAYAKENMVPSLREMLAKKEIELIIETELKGTINYDGTNRPHMLAWHTKEDLNKGSLGIDATGRIGYTDKDKRQLVLNDSLPRQQLWFAWRAYNDYVAVTQLDRKPLAHDDLKRYVKANSLPSVSQLVDSGAMWLADPASPGPHAACFKIEPPQTQTYAIALKGGQVGVITPAVAAASFPKK